MSKARPRSRRVWPLACCAAFFWLAWVATMQTPLALHPNPSLYLTAQRGCVGVWVWSPAERRSLGIRGDLDAFGAERSWSMSHKPFLWCDMWGYAAGGPLWIPAAFLTVLAVRRYAWTSVRDAPPATRHARYWAVMWLFLFCSATLALLATGYYREETLLTIGGKQLSAQNGAIALERPQEAIPILTSGTGISGSFVWSIPPELPQRSTWHIDLFPDWSSSPPLWRLTFPLWPLVAAFGWVALVAAKRARFQGEGLCDRCGYNLKGLALTAACPECGTARS